MLAFLSCAIWAWLLAAHGRFWQAGPMLTPAQPRTTPDVAVVVPARDEAEHIGEVLRSLLAQDYAGAWRVILVDDGSTDGTGEIARAIGDARLTVIPGSPRPTGWSGKSWALAQGVAATEEALVFLTDADISHDPRHLSTLVERAERGGREMVSEMVALRRESWAERALVPAFVYFFQLLYPFARVNDALDATAAAAGGTVLIRRRALERIGGIAAIRGTLIDDVALAQAVKRGGTIWLGHSALARSLRAYPGFGDIWRMIARTAFTQLRHSAWLLLLCAVAMALVWFVPVLSLLFAHGWARLFGLLAWAGSMASFLPTLRRFGASPAWALALPLVAAFYLAATIGSAIAHWRGRGAVWKNRAYAEAGS